MNPIWDILLTTGELFTLIMGISGLILSLFLLLAPEALQSLSGRFDYWFHVDEKLAFLDRHLKTDGFVFRHHILLGISMIGGSVFFLVFLFLKLDVARLLDIFFNGSRLQPVAEVLVSALIILGKLSGFIGIVLGTLLIFAVGSVMGLETRMSAGMTPQPVIDKLNQFNDGIDRVFLRYPVVLGLFGLAASVFLTFVGSTFLFMV